MSSSVTDILVPVGDSETFRNTVAHVVREAKEEAKESDTKPTVHFVYPIRWRSIQGVEVVSDDPEDMFERIRLWAREDLDGENLSEGDLPIDIVTERIGKDRYLFSPADYAAVINDYARNQSITRVVLDPEYSPAGTAPLMEPLFAELQEYGLSVEEAPVERIARREPVSRGASIPKVGLVFATSYAFYLILGGTLGTFNLATGALVAMLSTAIFAGITAEKRPLLRTFVPQIVRMAIYIPYLLWEIAKANVTVAYIILHPKLPIDPAMQRFEAAVWGEYSVTSLANSITLTPGTLTVDVHRDSFYIHTLTENAREGLAGGSLERAIRFVFYGRKAMDIPSPAERGACSEPMGIGVSGKRLEELSWYSGGGEIRVPERPEGWGEE